MILSGGEAFRRREVLVISESGTLVETYFEA